MPYLIEHYAEPLRNVHFEEPPGAARVGQCLQSELGLPQQMKVQGRTRTYLCLVASLARIFRRWKRRSKAIDDRDFRRGRAPAVAQLAWIRYGCVSRDALTSSSKAS
jgi:hypothetical protein